MTTEEYQRVIENREPLINFNGELKHFPFHISPKLKKHPLELLPHLGDQPCTIKESDFELNVLYPGGVITYWEFNNMIIPSQVLIYGVTSQATKRSLNTEIFDTKITFWVKENHELKPNDNYLSFGDLHLRIDVLEGEKEIPKDWWYTDRRG